MIRDGLRVSDEFPAGEELVNDVLAVLRARQVFGGTVGALPGLRSALAIHFGLDEQVLLTDPGVTVDVPATLTRVVDGPNRTAADVVDLLESLARKLIVGIQTLGWDVKRVADVVVEVLGERVSAVLDVLRFACEQVVPRLARTTDEVTNVLRALDGRFVPPRSFRLTHPWARLGVADRT